MAWLRVSVTPASGYSWVLVGVAREGGEVRQTPCFAVFSRVSERFSKTHFLHFESSASANSATLEKWLRQGVYDIFLCVSIAFGRFCTL